jgi:hypothetical protein
MIYDIFQEKCQTKSDINEHLEVIYNYSKKCNHVTEFGVRDVVSTWAILAAKPNKAVSYDISRHPNVAYAEELAKKEEVNWQFIQGDTLSINIEETDFLFIDTLHIYEQLKKELNLHANKVKKYIAFHDTTSFGDVSEYGGIGLWRAIEEFLNENKNWRILERRTNNNGFTIIERI